MSTQSEFQVKLASMVYALGLTKSSTTIGDGHSTIVNMDNLPKAPANIPSVNELAPKPQVSSYGVAQGMDAWKKAERKRLQELGYGMPQIETALTNAAYRNSNGGRNFVDMSRFSGPKPQSAPDLVGLLPRPQVYTAGQTAGDGSDYYKSWQGMDAWKNAERKRLSAAGYSKRDIEMALTNDAYRLSGGGRHGVDMRGFMPNRKAKPQAAAAGAAAAGAGAAPQAAKPAPQAAELPMPNQSTYGKRMGMDEWKEAENDRLFSLGYSDEARDTALTNAAYRNSNGGRNFVDMSRFKTERLRGAER